MKNRHNCLVGAICVVLVIPTIINAQGTEATAPTTTNPAGRVYAKTDLPSVGMTVVSPLKSEIRYFFSTAWQKAMETKISADQRRLYMCRDKGATWTALCDHLNFVEIFVHPDTGVLYAIIAEVNALVENDKCILERRSVVMKIVTSADGKGWKDITRGEDRRYRRFCGLSKDPEHPSRIRVGAVVDGIRTHSFILQAVDDQHSAWCGKEYDLFGSDRPAGANSPPQ